MSRKKPRLTKKEKKAATAPVTAGPAGPGARTVTRSGIAYKVSAGMSGETLAIAESYFQQRDRRGGPADDMIEFIRPLMYKAQAEGNVSMMKTTLTFGKLFWNISLMTNDEQAVALQEAEDVACKDEEDRAAFRRLAVMLMTRHREMFPHLHDQAGDQEG